jgi:hypothetical protein
LASASEARLMIAGEGLADRLKGNEKVQKNSGQLTVSD